MKQVRRTQSGKLVVAQAPYPQIKLPDDVIVKVHYASICADDLFSLSESYSESYYDNGIGHEFSGEIVELGDEAARQCGFSVGDRVSGFSWLFCGKCPYCRRGMENMCINLTQFVGVFAEYMLLKDRQLVLLPDQVSMRAGCLTELVSACLHGIDRVNILPGHSVLIVGGGGAGLTMLLLSLLKGGVRVTLSEPSESKRQLARKLGAHYVINPDEENIFEATSRITNNMGYDVIIDAAHNIDVIHQMPGIVAKRGSILLFSLYNYDDNAMLNLSELYVKECTILTSYMAPYMLQRTVELLTILDVEKIIGKVFPLNEVQAAFDTYAQGLYPRVCIKIGQ